MADERPIPEEPSSIDTTGNLPHIITGWLLQFLRFHFSDPRNITQSKLKDYIWRPDERLTKIVIQPIYAWEPRNIQQRPAIILKRHDWKTNQLAMGDVYQGPPELDGYEENRYAIQIVGAHSIFCHGMTGLEADELGAEVGYQLLEYQQYIRNEFNLLSFRMTGIGEVRKNDEPHEHFVVPITVEYTFVHVWRLLQESPIWSKVGYRITDGS